MRFQTHVARNGCVAVLLLLALAGGLALDFYDPGAETPIPEPGAAMMLAVGLAGLLRRPGRRGQPRPAHPSMPLGSEACGPTGPIRGTAAIAS